MLSLKFHFQIFQTSYMGDSQKIGHDDETGYILFLSIEKGGSGEMHHFTHQ